MNFATPEEEIAYLRKVLETAWALFCDCYLAEEKPDEIRRSAAFRKYDAELRRLGVLRQAEGNS
jgi:hypothetical protein